jgi:hypothetical protein
MNAELLVYYPRGGVLQMLYWWTQHERGHLVLAPTEQGTRAIARRVFEEHPDAEIRAYCEIEVVGPPRRLHVLAESHALREAIDMFHREVVSLMRDAVKEGRSLPPPFEVCERYEIDKDEEDDETGSADEWSRSVHYGCKHCMETIRMVGLTPAELWALHHEAWQKLPFAWKRGTARRDLKRQPHRGPAGVDGEPLWSACAEFGDHAAGIALAEVDWEGVEQYSVSCLTDRLLFFFRRGPELDPGPLQQMLDEEKARWKALREQQEQQRMAEREQEDRQRLDEGLSFFATRKVS